METQFPHRAPQMPAVRLADRGRRLRRPIGVIFNWPVVNQRQGVQPLAYLGFQFDLVPVTHIREYIARRVHRTHPDRDRRRRPQPNDPDS